MIMDVQAYLDRIGASFQAECSLQYLSELQYKQVTSVIFENIDILQGIEVSTDTSHLFEKIVTQRRGGVCFELNSLYGELLRGLGFQVRMIAGTAYRGEGVWGEEDTHAANVLHLEGIDYLADAGFGGNSPRIPVPFTGEIVTDADGDYRIRHFEAPDIRVLEKREHDDWTILYRFNNEQTWTASDFNPLCEWVRNTDRFSRIYFLMKVTDRGRLTLFDHTLTEVKDKVKTKRQIAPDELPQVLKLFI